METVVFGAKEVLAEKGRPVLLSSAPMIHGHLYLLPNTRVWLDGWTGCIETLVKFASSSGPCSSPTQLVFPGIYARLRLPSRFRKLLGLSFISANWMEYSWPFQWNQLTPCEKEKASRWVSTRQGVHRPLLLGRREQGEFCLNLTIWYLTAVYCLSVY